METPRETQGKAEREKEKQGKRQRQKDRDEEIKGCTHE